MNWIVGIVGATWEVGLESAPYVLLGFAVAGLIRGLLRPGVLTKHLGKNNLSTVVKAALFGIPIPLCSCGVVAAAGAIRKEGASKGATSAFLIATPETGVQSVYHVCAAGSIVHRCPPDRRVHHSHNRGIRGGLAGSGESRPARRRRGGLRSPLLLFFTAGRRWKDGNCARVAATAPADRCWYSILVHGLAL